MTEADAQALGIALERRHEYLGVDDGKNNLARLRTVQTWFQKCELSPGLGRCLIDYTRHVLLAKNASNAQTGKAELVATTIRRQFGANQVHELLAVIAATETLAATWGDRGEWTTYFRRDVLGGLQSQSCRILGGVLQFKSMGRGKQAKVALMLDVNPFGQVDDEVD